MLSDQEQNEANQRAGSLAMRLSMGVGVLMLAGNGRPM
jgi:hypothetical protein